MSCARRSAGARKPAPSTSASSPRRPDAGTGRSCARLFHLPVLSLLLGALGLGHATPAAADVLVSNIDQTQGSNPNFSGQFTTQGFTTGSHSDGYTLESIEVKLTVTSALSDRVNFLAKLLL